jgi:hypothetical protein
LSPTGRLSTTGAAENTNRHGCSLINSKSDGLGEYPLQTRAATPASVPVLAWVGDQDTFDPITTRSRWSTLSSNLSFQVMEGWSHDFGPKPNAGFSRVADLVKAFYGQ